MNKLIGLALLATLTACSASVTNIQQVNGAATAEKGTADKVGAYAKSTTPPTGATSMGMMSSPTAGNTTVPITNVEVFVFTASVDSSPGDDTLYWAYDSGSDTVYVWGQIALDCVDDSGASTGETGAADVVYADGPGGSGWLTSTDACGYSTVYGCSDDGSGEVCGGCDWNDAFITCVVES
jgi:hypothetical protein